MSAADKEAVRGFLLDRWLEDLRHDRAPEPLPEMKLLSGPEIEEVLELARFYKATLYPSPVTDAEVRRVGSRLRGQIRQEQRKTREAITAVERQERTFIGLLNAARRVREIEPSRLEEALAMPRGMVNQLEGATVSPHRVPVEKLAALLRALRLTSSHVVDLVRQASFEWAQRVYTQPATQLGRTDAVLGFEERRQVLEDGAAAVDEAGLARELARIDQYCHELAARLG